MRKRLHNPETIEDVHKFATFVDLYQSYTTSNGIYCHLRSIRRVRYFYKVDLSDLSIRHGCRYSTFFKIQAERYLKYLWSYEGFKQEVPTSIKMPSLTKYMVGSHRPTTWNEESVAVARVHVPAMLFRCSSVQLPTLRRSLAYA